MLALLTFSIAHFHSSPTDKKQNDWYVQKKYNNQPAPFNGIIVKSPVNNCNGINASAGSRSNWSKTR
jgi:hypothetical protein